ncbi:MAG: hypothetical protein ACYDIA_02605 [Candidatus Humimicrobiaceae bacterium]
MEKEEVAFFLGCFGNLKISQITNQLKTVKVIISKEALNNFLAG